MLFVAHCITDYVVLKKKENKMCKSSFDGTLTKILSQQLLDLSGIPPYLILRSVFPLPDESVPSLLAPFLVSVDSVALRCAECFYSAPRYSRGDLSANPFPRILVHWTCYQSKYALLQNNARCDHVISRTHEENAGESWL